MADASRFPSVAWFRVLADRLNSDTDFGQLARWTDARIGFSVHGEPIVVLTVVAGKIVQVEEGEGLRGVDYALDGPAEGWAAFFGERASLTFATNRLYGRLRILGNLALAAGDHWTLASMCRRFKSVSVAGVPS